MQQRTVFVCARKVKGHELQKTGLYIEHLKESAVPTFFQRRIEETLRNYLVLY